MVSAFAGGADVQSGRVTLDVARLVENGNAMPVTVESQMTATDHVRRIALFNEKNPQAADAHAHFVAPVGEHWHDRPFCRVMPGEEGADRWRSRLFQIGNARSMGWYSAIQ